MNKQIVCQSALYAAAERVKSTCDKEVKPSHLFILLDDKQKQCRFAEYAAEMFETHKVRRFGGFDSHLDYTLDGTLCQINKMLFEIKSAAGYTNFYEGILTFDISALSDSLDEKQSKYFFAEIAKCAEYATVIFYASPEIRNLSALINRVCAEIDNVEVLYGEEYKEKYIEMSRKK